MKATEPNKKLIKDTHFSAGFIEVLSHVQIIGMEQLLKLTPEELTSIPNFTFQMLVEYRTFLETNNINHK